MRNRRLEILECIRFIIAEKKGLHFILPGMQGSTGIYEKTDEEVEEFFTANGFHYYVFSNSKNVTAACAFDNVEVSIGMNGSREDLKALLETIG